MSRDDEAIWRRAGSHRQIAPSFHRRTRNDIGGELPEQDIRISFRKSV